METDFEMTVERENGPIEVTITAKGELSPADSDVGIMSDGIDEIDITATVDGEAFVLTDAENGYATDKADRLLSQLAHERARYGDE